MTTTKTDYTVSHKGHCLRSATYWAVPRCGCDCAVCQQQCGCNHRMCGLCASLVKSIAAGKPQANAARLAQFAA